MKKNLNLIISSAELADKLDELHTLAHNSIVNLMNSKGVTKVNLMVDQNGRDIDDEDYDDEWGCDHRVWVDCYGKYSNEVGYVSEVELGKDADGDSAILLTAEGEDGTYPNDYVSQSTCNLIDVLERLETILK